VSARARSSSSLSNGAKSLLGELREHFRDDATSFLDNNDWLVRGVDRDRLCAGSADVTRHSDHGGLRNAPFAFIAMKGGPE
jgi:hypothetical protein